MIVISLAYQSGDPYFDEDEEISEISLASMSKEQLYHVAVAQARALKRYRLRLHQLETMSRMEHGNKNESASNVLDASWRRTASGLLCHICNFITTIMHEMYYTIV